VSAIAVVGWIVFACVFGSAVIGMALRRLLPEEHLSTESKDVVKLGIALIATMAALVLSLLLSSAKTAFDERNAELAQMAGNIALLDRLLAHYGPEAKPVRQSLRAIVEAALAQVWPDENFHPTKLAPASAGPEAMYDMIEALSPQGEAQRSLRAQALATATGLAQARWLLVAQGTQSPIPLPFLIVLVFWLCIIFASFGLYAPANPTVVATLGVCALSVAAAIFLILELALPFVGVIRVSSAPLRSALAQLGR
jgi:hypothetical protein